MLFILKKLIIDSLNYARNVLTIEETDHRINQLHSGFIKLESDISTIYNYIDSFGYKSFTSSLIDPVDLRT